jgi:hypothetical protein
MRAPSHSPYSQWTFTVDFEASLGLFLVFAQFYEPSAFDLRGELVYHCRHSGIGHPILCEGESQGTTRELIWGVYEYAPAHWTFDVLVPPSTRPVKPRKEVFDHAQCTEGVTAVWMGYSHGVCAERDGLVSEGALGHARRLT